jgi:hypothetical protein
MSFFNPIQKFYMADEVVGLKITTDTGQSVQSIKSLRTEIRGAQDDLNNVVAKFGEMSPQAIEAAKHVAELRDKLDDSKKLVDAFNPDRKFQAFSGALQSVTGGFTALTGAMALFGVESEDVQKTLLKVQAALAISEGVNSILDGVQAFKNLGAVVQQSTIFIKANAAATALASAAMKAFGISVETTSTAFRVLKTVIASTGIGLLIVALGALVAAFKSAADAAENASQAQKRFLDNTVNASKAALEAGLRFNEQQSALEIARAKARGASEEEIFNIQKKWDDEKLQAKIRYYNDAGFADKDAADAVTDQALHNQINAYNQQAAANQRKLQQQKEAAEKSKQQAAKSAQEKAQLEAEFEDITKQRRGLGGADITTQAQQAADLQAQKDEAQAAADKKDQERYQQQQDILGKIGGSALKKEIDDKRAAAEAKQRIDDAETQAKLENMQATANGLNALSDLIGQQTVAGKILAIASATINTYVGATKALAQGGFLGIAGAAAVIAAGLASVKKIIATNVPGRATGGSAGSAPSLNTQAPLSPQAPVVRTSTSLDANSINQIGQATTKTYVLESDVTNNQQRVAMLNRQARIG